MPGRSGHGGRGRSAFSSHHNSAIHHYGTHYSSYGSHGSHGSGYRSHGGGGHYHFGGQATLHPLPALQTPAQAAYADALAMYLAYYQSSGCCPASFPYLGALLSLVSLALTIASLATPWVYLGGSQPFTTTGRSERYWGIAASLTGLQRCSSFLPCDPDNRDYWFSSPSWCPDEPAPYSSANLQPAPFLAYLVLGAAAAALHLAALLCALPCECCCCKRPLPTRALSARHAGVLGLKLAPAALLLLGSLSALHGPLTPAAIHKAVGSPAPGFFDGPGAVLARVALALAWGAVACEGCYLAGLLAHSLRRRLYAAAPAPPPGFDEASAGLVPPLQLVPPPSDLEARALAQGEAMMAAGQLPYMQPKPLLPEDYRAFGCAPPAGLQGGGEAGGALPALESAGLGLEGKGQDQYYSRLRLYRGEALQECAFPAAAGAAEEAAAAAAAAAAGGAVAEVVLVLAQFGGSRSRVRVRLGDMGTLPLGALPQAAPMGAQALQVLLAQQMGGAALPLPLPAASPEAHSFCSGCGAKLDEGARFCGHCGLAVK